MVGLAARLRRFNIPRLCGSLERRLLDDRLMDGLLKSLATQQRVHHLMKEQHLLKGRHLMREVVELA